MLVMCIVSCGGKQSQSEKLIQNIDREMLRVHKLPYGNLIATYDLAKPNLVRNKRIYSSDYVLAINNERYNDLFLKKFKKNFKQEKLLWNEIMIKTIRIRDLMIKLNNKYRFLNLAEVGFLNAKPTSSNNRFGLLAKLDKMISSVPLMLPLHNPYISSHYGMRKHPIKKKRMFHCGTDLVALKSSPVYSSADGVVIKVASEKKYGNTIIVKHSHHLTTKYAHLKSINITVGDKVIRGQMIGYQGKTGNVTGEHLHYEIWLRDKHIDPFDFIAHSEL